MLTGIVSIVIPALKRGFCISDSPLLRILYPNPMRKIYTRLTLSQVSTHDMSFKRARESVAAFAVAHVVRWLR